MNTYIVTQKLDGIEVYRYNSDTPIEWNGMEFNTHEHTLLNTEASIPLEPHTWTRLEYLRRFTQDERILIRATAANSPALQDYLELLNQAEEINSADPDIINALHMLETYGLIAQGRAREILT